MKCIYCLQEKEKKLFNREHIIPKAFGTFGTSTPTLIYKVCISCNQRLGDTIDNELSRSGINFDRHPHKIFKKDKDFSHQKYLPSTKINIASGKYEGQEVDLSSNDSRKITHPKADFGLIQENASYKYYTINNLPSLEEVNKALNLQVDGFLVPLINNIDQVINIFKERYDILLNRKEESEEAQECSITFKINAKMSI